LFLLKEAFTKLESKGSEGIISNHPRAPTGSSEVVSPLMSIYEVLLVACGLLPNQNNHAK
jgi:hypothetical protein